MANIETNMRVELLTHTPNPLSLIYASFRQCYHAGFVADLWNKLLSGEILYGEQADFIEKIIASGHESPIEHVTLTFAVSGVSRALTHQLVRHRIASYSQQSQRYVKADNFSYVVPPSIKKNKEAYSIFCNCMDTIAKSYRDIQEILNVSTEKQQKINKNIEDVRFVLPQAIETKIIITMNCRSLYNFFAERCCSRAQWEIRNMANQMLKLAKESIPVIFDKAGAKCEKTGYCPEGEVFGCSKYPVG